MRISGISGYAAVFCLLPWRRASPCPPHILSYLARSGYKMVSAAKRKSIGSSVVSEDTASSDAGKASKKFRSSAASTSPTAASAPTTPTKEDEKTKLLSQLCVGSRIEVWWTGDKKYYPGIIVSRVQGGSEAEFFVQYDDGDYQDLDLREERFRIMKGGKSNSVRLLADSNLVVPDDIDTSKLPNKWEDIVRAELKACGLGAHEEYQRQLEAYDSSDDDAGEPPTPPSIRNRLGRDRAAAHYKVTHTDARLLVKVVDANLERAGIHSSWQSKFTEHDDRLIQSLYEAELKASANACARRGFWGEVAEEHFAGRGLTAQVISARCNFIVKKSKPRSDDGDAARAGVKTSQSMFTEDDGCPGGKLTDADLTMMARLVQKELEETNGDRVRRGFWSEVVEDHFAGRGFTAEQLRNYYKKNKRRQMNEREETLKGVSGDHFTDAEDIPGGNGEEEKTALPGGFTDEEYHLMERLVREELKRTGNDRVRPGFWDGLLQKSFSDRNMTSKALCRCYSKIKSLKMAEKPTADDAEKQRVARSHGEPFTAEEDNPDGLSENMLKDADFKLMRELVETELEETNGDRVRYGFWGKVVEDHFAGHNLTADQLRRRYRKYKQKNLADASNGISDDEDACAPEARSSHGEKFTSEEDGIIIKEVAKELRDHGKLRNGFWRKVVEEHSLNRTSTQLSNRCSYLKIEKGVDLSASSSSNNEATTSDHHGDSSNAKRGSNALDGPSKFCHQDDHLMEKLVREELNETRTGKVRLGFWRKVLDKYFSGRDLDPKALSSRFFYLKSSGKIDLSASTSSEIETIASEPEPNFTLASGDETSDIASSSGDTVPLTDGLIVLPAYQATVVKYPPQSRVIYRPSSGESEASGRVLEVGIYPSLDNLYVYTIAEDAGGQQHERIPERFLEKLR